MVPPLHRLLHRLLTASSLLAGALALAAGSATASADPDSAPAPAPAPDAEPDADPDAEPDADPGSDPDSDPDAVPAPALTPAPAPVDPTVCVSLGPARPVAAGARAGYAAAAAGGVRSEGAVAVTALTVDAGASVWLGTGPCARSQELAIDASVTPRWEGGVGAAAGMAASIRHGATPHRDPELAIVNWAPTSWELAYAGDLRRRPALSDRADVARDVFDRFAVTAATRGFRVETADVCRPDDTRQHCRDGRGSTTPESLTLDLAAFDGELALVDQAARRVEQRFSGALLRVLVRQSATTATSLHGQLDLLRLDVAASQVGDVTAEVTTVWPIRLDTTNPDTGTRYVIGYGFTSVRVDTPTRPRVRDHRERAVGGVGATFGPGPRGVGVGWVRSAYLTMAAEPVLDDRLTAEGWVLLRGHALRARGFASRLERLEPAMGQAPVVWTAGAELGARRALGGFDVDATVEAGRSYYAVLDGSAPGAVDEPGRRAGRPLTRGSPSARLRGVAGGGRRRASRGSIASR